MTAKKVDLLVLILLILIGSLYSYLTQGLFIGKAVFCGAMFTIPSALYLGYREKKNWRKIIIATLLFGAFYGLYFEIVQEFTNSYKVVSGVLPKILGIAPIDNVLGHVMMTFLTLTFYEHFVNRKKSRNISWRIKIGFSLGLIANIATFVLLQINPNLLVTDYPYFYMGILAIIPVMVFSVIKPEYIKDMAVSAIYFFFLYLTIELFAVKYSWWIYPGNNYIGYVTLVGLTFPFEELFFWMLFYSSALISYYELFMEEEW